ncbi:hypothetical protein [[Clostridium] hylemonae]|uniref:hypothetical protein n=1 Tax=[Clostridium] hylemonae TaxID=89153 RepID=UPI001105A831|nr:hypothetical protein [[Clostridium] hylemonae]
MRTEENRKEMPRGRSVSLSGRRRATGKYIIVKVKKVFRIPAGAMGTAESSGTSGKEEATLCS